MGGRPATISLGSTDPATNPAALVDASSVTFSVNFSEPVTNVSAADFVVAGGRGHRNDRARNLRDTGWQRLFLHLHRNGR